MELWQRARSLAEDAVKRSHDFTVEAARKSQEFTVEAARRSQDFSIGSSKLSYIVAEASKKADLIKVEAIKRADQIKSRIPNASALSNIGVSTPEDEEEEDLESFGVTEELREFVKNISVSTFKEFPIQDDTEMSDVPTVSNIRQDLTKWQEVHAKLVLSTVKEISKLRYELCPRVMKERKFWRIYFILVNSHVAPYEKRYNEDAKRRSAEEVKVKDDLKSSEARTISKSETGAVQKTKSLSSAATEQDLDVFLLGDLGDSDDGPDDKDGGFDDDDDDDFDKL